MNLQIHGTTTSDGKVTRIEAHGFFLEAQEKQYFVPFADYPVFRRATVAEIFEMEARFPGSFHWPSKVTSDRTEVREMLRAAGLLSELGPELQRRADPTISLDEVIAELDQADEKPLSEIIIEQRRSREW